MREVVVLSAVRTPIGRFGGALKALTAVDLGRLAVQEALVRARVEPGEVDLVVLGHARPAGVGPNPARQVLIRAGIPCSAPAFTVNQACGSGLAAVSLAADRIRLGEADVVVAAGAESMTRVPYLLPHARWGRKMGHDTLVDSMYQDGFMCPLAGMVMGETVEHLAERYGLSREEQDAFALESQVRANRAWEEGRFDAEVVPVATGEARLERDEHPRADTTLEKLAKLPGVFSREGTITAGNSSGLTDGASALVLMAADVARARGLDPLARFVAGWAAGVDPREMGIGPVAAMRRWFDRHGGSMEDFDLVELNEAFAAQVLACVRDLDLPRERLNVNGGAIALGHPIGCSGNRLAVTLIHEMRRRQARRGLATLCVSGGQGLAAIFELP